MTLSERIVQVQQQILQLERTWHRPSGSVRLLAVSKGHTADNIRQAYADGLHEFGENYLQEALEKIKSLADLPVCWHFIGSIQSNKAQAIASHFSWVHSVSSIKIARALNDKRPHHLPPLNVCIQVNIDNEETKSGIQPEQATELAMEITRLPRLCLRGLMVIPKPSDDESQQYHTYLSVSELLTKANNRLKLSLDTLSMGMSHDLSPAIHAGSTMVRVGTAIFGERIYKTRQ